MPSDHCEIYGLPDTALASDLYDARFKGGTVGFPSSPVWYESVVAVPFGMSIAYEGGIGVWRPAPAETSPGR